MPEDLHSAFELIPVLDEVEVHHQNRERASGPARLSEFFLQDGMYLKEIEKPRELVLYREVADLFIGETIVHGKGYIYSELLQKVGAVFRVISSGVGAAKQERSEEDFSYL